MKSASSWIVIISIVLLTGATLIAKGTGVGIYARIDDVAFEKGSSGRLVGISGVFEVPVPMSSGCTNLRSVGIYTSGFLLPPKKRFGTSWTS